MTTVLKGEQTYFLPFNQGSNGAGNSGGKRNPANPDGYLTAYLWEKVLTKDSILVSLFPDIFLFRNGTPNKFHDCLG